MLVGYATGTTSRRRGSANNRTNVVRGLRDGGAPRARARTFYRAPTHQRRSKCARIWLANAKPNTSNIMRDPDASAPAQLGGRARSRCKISRMRCPTLMDRMGNAHKGARAANKNDALKIATGAAPLPCEGALDGIASIVAAATRAQCGSSRLARGERYA